MSENSVVESGKISFLIFRIVGFDKSSSKLRCEITNDKTSKLLLSFEIESSANHLSVILNQICHKTRFCLGNFVLVTDERIILTQTHIYDYLKITDSKTSILESYTLETLLDKNHIPFNYLRYIAECKQISRNIGRQKLIYNLITKNYNSNYNTELEISLSKFKKFKI